MDHNGLFEKLVLHAGSSILFFLKSMIFIFKILVKSFLFYFIFYINFLNKSEMLKISSTLINHF